MPSTPQPSVPGPQADMVTEWASGATDDMAALRAVFDGNGDGKLTSADAKFGDFKVLVTNAGGL